MSVRQNFLEEKVVNDLTDERRRLMDNKKVVHRVQSRKICQVSVNIYIHYGILDSSDWLLYTSSVIYKHAHG
jgi:hypothetical protein